MKTQRNMAGGIAIILGPGDSLADVPSSHADIITTEIRRFFTDPIQHFQLLADRCKYSNMADWLRRVTASGKWSLVLEEGFMMDRATQGSFWLWSDDVTPAFVAPSLSSNAKHPIAAFNHYYSLVDVVSWESFGCSGGLLGARGHIPLAAYGVKSRSKAFPTAKSVIWGNTACGDMLIYSGNQAGFLSHENGKAYSLGPIEKGIDFAFGELLAKRTPEFDYTKAR